MLAHAHVEFSHFPELIFQVRWHDPGRMVAANEFRDVDGETTHPLDLHRAVERGQNGAQVAGHWCLQGQQRLGEPFAGLARLVQRGILLDHLLGESHIAVEQGRGGAPHGVGGELAHAGQLISQLY